MKVQPEKGTIIVEAVMIFPLVILTVVMLLTIGNAYYQRSRVESIIETKVINDSAYCADGLLRITADGGNLPTDVKDAPEIAPYKYIFSGGTRNIVQSVQNEIADEVRSLDSGYFKGMEIKNFILKLDYSNYFITQSVEANSTYEINIPISLFGTKFKINCSSHIVVPLSDSPEFIRNVDMVIDYIERTKLDDNFKESIEKVKTFLGS